MTLIQEADLADKISDALSEYREPNYLYAQDIKAAKAALDSLSWALHEIDGLLEKDTSELDRVEKDLKFVHVSIVDTLDDIWTIIGRIGNGSKYLLSEDYQRSWKEIASYCQRMGNVSLAARIDTYRRFILALCQVLKRKTPAQQEFKSLQFDVRALGQTYNKGLIQDKDVTQHDPDRMFGQILRILVLTKTFIVRISRKQSYERERKRGGLPPLSPTDSNGSRDPWRFVPNNIPSPPTSPTATFSSISQMSSLDGEMPEHWAKAVFSQMSSTKLPLTNEPSRYYEDRDHPPSENPDSRYDEVLMMSFLPDVRVTLHCRPSDMRAKMMLALPIDRGQKGYISLSLNKLTLRRSRCMLRFYHPSRDKRTNIPWVSLQFSTYERLILFACTFVSMRCQSGAPPADPSMIWDDEHRDELEVYRGKIHDGSHRLTLCIYKDRSSNAVRLQVTKRTGSKAGTPVWTAFVTHEITSATWCEVVEKQIVFLTALYPHVFKFNYKLDKAPSGAFILDFESSSDAKAFVKTIDALRVDAISRTVVR